MKKILALIFIFGFLASCQNEQTNPVTPQNSSSTNIQGNTEISSAQPLTTPAIIEDKAPVGKTEDGAITYGNGAARVQIFADFQCPACQQADENITPVLDILAEEGKITLEYRQFPLTQIHNNAFADANAALCAADQNMYRQYKHEMYALERAKRGGKISDEDRITIAKKLNMSNEGEFLKCITEQKYKSQVETDMKLGGSLGVTGTPTFFLDGKQLSMSPFASVKKDKKENIIDFQQKLKKFLEDYVEHTSKNANPTVTMDETPVQENTENIGGVVSTGN